MKKNLAFIMSLFMLLGIVAGCAQPAVSAPSEDAAQEAAADVPMAYMTADELEAVLGTEGYLVLDVRKAADYAAAHIPGAISVDMDAAVQGDIEAGTAAMKAAIEGVDDTLVLVCYSGKKYAQASTNILSSLGYDTSKVFTLQDGFNNWSEAKADLIETGEGVAVTPAAVAFEGQYVVNAQYVLDHMGDANVLLVDARGEDAAKKGTVEGAIAVIWQMFAAVSEGAAGDPMWGTVLEPAALSEALGAAGISPDKEIILFAAAQNGWGDDGRILWELVAAGFPNVKMVDGGYDALVAAGAPIVKGAAAYTPAEVTIEAIDETHLINTDALAADYANYKIVDVRADEEYEGQVLYGEAKGGHLPGAIHIRYTDLFNEDCTLKTNEEIIAMFEAAGLAKTDNIVTYCTAGIRSAYMQLILEMCGYENTWNYDESYYRWCACQEVE